MLRADFLCQLRGHHPKRTDTHPARLGGTQTEQDIAQQASHPAAERALFSVRDGIHQIIPLLYSGVKLPHDLNGMLEVVIHGEQIPAIPRRQREPAEQSRLLPAVLGQVHRGNPPVRERHTVKDCRASVGAFVVDQHNAAGNPRIVRKVKKTPHDRFHRPLGIINGDHRSDLRPGAHPAAALLNCSETKEASSAFIPVCTGRRRRVS